MLFEFEVKLDDPEEELEITAVFGWTIGGLVLLVVLLVVLFVVLFVVLLVVLLVVLFVVLFVLVLLTAIALHVTLTNSNPLAQIIQCPVFVL